MEKPLVSIFIAAYNCEGTISRCLNSILCQTYKNFECIVVDDGSNDSTSAIVLNCFCRLDKRFRLITSHKNLGPALAKQKALSLCNGKYLFNCDGDDYFTDCCAFEICVDLMENSDVDILEFGYTKFFEHYSREYARPDATFSLHSDKEKASFLLNDFSRGALFRNIWSKCFRADIISSRNYLIPPVSIADDYFFVIGLVLCANKIQTISKNFYGYVSYDNPLSVNNRDSELYETKTIESYISYFKPYISKKFSREEIYLSDVFAIMKLNNWQSFFLNKEIKRKKYLSILHSRIQFFPDKRMNSIIRKSLTIRNKVLFSACIKRSNFAILFLINYVRIKELLGRLFGKQKD